MESDVKKDEPKVVSKLEENKNEEKQKEVFGALHLTNLAVIPGVNVSCEVNNPEEIKNLQKIYDDGGKIVLVTSKTFTPVPQKEDIFDFACLGIIERVELTPSGTLKANIQGKERVKILSVLSVEPIRVEIEKVEEINGETERAYKLVSDIKNKCVGLNKYGHFMPFEIEQQVLYSNLLPGQIADSLVHILLKDVSSQQKMLSETNVEKRLSEVNILLDNVFDTIKWKKQIDDKVNDNLSKTQKEMFLREQMKVINDELNGEENEIEEFKNKVKKLGMPKEHEEKVLKEIDRQLEG